MLLLAAPVSAKMVKGVVVHVDGDHIVIATQNGYTVAELYGGYYALAEKDLVVGELESYGFTDLYCPSTDRQAHVYVDDFWLSAERAAKWLVEQR